MISMEKHTPKQKKCFHHRIKPPKTLRLLLENGVGAIPRFRKISAKLVTGQGGLRVVEEIVPQEDLFVTYELSLNNIIGFN